MTVEEKPNTGFQNQREEKGIGVCEAIEDPKGRKPKAGMKRKKWMFEIYKELQSFDIRFRSKYNLVPY